MDKSKNDTPPPQEQSEPPIEQASPVSSPESDELSLAESDQGPLQESDEVPPGESSQGPAQKSAEIQPEDNSELRLAEDSPMLAQADDEPPLPESYQLPTPDSEALPLQNGSRMPLILAGVALVAAFAVGLIGGFLARPLVLQDVPVQVVVTVIPPENPQAVAQADRSAAPATGGSSTNQGDNPAQTGPTSDTTSAGPVQPTPTIMDFLLADARHFQGSAEAPLILIEFSDFK